MLEGVRNYLHSIVGIMDVACLAMSSVGILFTVEEGADREALIGVIMDSLPSDIKDDVSFFATKVQTSILNDKVHIHPKWERLCDAEQEPPPSDIVVPVDRYGNICIGTTLKGKPCRNKTRNRSGLCWRHWM